MEEGAEDCQEDRQREPLKGGPGVCFPAPPSKSHLLSTDSEVVQGSL